MTAQPHTPAPEPEPQAPVASPELLTSMLLEAAQRFLGQAVDAMGRRDFVAKWHAINRVSAIIEELSSQLDHEKGGELVDNLLWVYDWWTVELHRASTKLETDRMENLSHLIGELRQGWEQVHASRARTAALKPTFVPGMVAV